MEWQPINTAPKDGTRILLSAARVFIGSWRIPRRIEWLHLETHEVEKFAWGEEPAWVLDDGINFVPGEITHWMPLSEKAVMIWMRRPRPSDG